MQHKLQTPRIPKYGNIHYEYSQWKMTRILIILACVVGLE